MTRTHKHHWTFRLWVKIRGLLALCVVLLGVLVGLATLLLPFDQLYKDKLESFLAAQWDMAVAVEEIQGSWKGFGPHFQLKGLTLEGKQTVEVADTSVSLNVYEFVIPGGKTGINLSINHADLDMVQSEKGHNITINNDRDEAKFTEMLDKILTTGGLSVSELNLNVANDQGEVLLSGLKAAFVLEQDSENRAMSLVVDNEGQSSLQIKSIGPKSKHLSKDANWHLALDDFDLSQFNDLQSDTELPALVLDGSIWLQSKEGVIVGAQAELAWRIAQSSGLITWQHQGENQHWTSRYQLSELQSADQVFDDVSGQLLRDGDHIYWHSDDLNLAWLNQLMATHDDDWPTFTVQGVLSKPAASYDFRQNIWQSGQAQLEVQSLLHERFSLANLGAQVLWKNAEWQVMLSGQQGRFEMPSFVRGSVNWSELHGQLTVLMSGPYPRVNVNQFWCDCGDFIADAQGQYWLTAMPAELNNASDSAPSDPAKMLQLQAKVSSVDVAELHHYWPHNVWKPKTIAWLDKGLLAGTVASGYLFQFGQLTPKAFEHGQAVFDSRAYLKDVEVEFNPEWPEAKGIYGQAQFTGLGFSATLYAASSMGLKMQHAQVNMDAYKQSHIDVAVQAQANGNDMFDYLNQTPIIQQVPLDEQMTLSGQQRVDLNVRVPLNKSLKAIPKGSVYFDQAGFSTSHLELNNLNGQVVIDGFDLKIDGLDGTLMDQAVQVSGLIQTQSEQGVLLDVSLQGAMEAAPLMATQQLDLPIQGTSDWQIDISNPNKQLHMNMSSALLGTAIDLPAPLNKPAQSDKSFTISCDIPCVESDVFLTYGDEIISQLSPGEQGLEIKQLQFKKALNSSDEQLLLGGHVSELDVDNWLVQIKQWSAQKEVGRGQNPWPLPAPSFKLQVDDMLFMARRFKDVSIDVQRLDTAYQIDIDSALMKGRLLIADDLVSHGVVADFEYLNWIEAKADDLAKSTQVAEKMPDLHIYAEAFSYLDIPFGELRLEMRNVIDGMRVETMSLISDSSNIQISGDWVASKGDDGSLGVSDFSIVMTSEKIATFLQNMDFEAPITDAQTLIQLYASWEGTPSMFDLKNINGTLNLKMGEGEVLDTKPGFGRVLGLFSLTNLPRRLILDFKDVMAEGLHFDSMEGQFVLNNGYAETDDFLIKASAANIKVVGLTGFADKSYHQTIIIEPQVGKTFPTLGAIAGGAVGAAAGFFVQGLLNKKLKSSNRITYQVTGSWDKPIIEVIDNE